MTNQFTNPYLLPREELVRLQTLVSEKDMLYLKGMRLHHGTVSTAVNLLFQKLVNELKARGLESQAQQEQFEHFVSNCVITIQDHGTTTNRKPGKPTGKSSKKGDVQHD